MKTTHKFIYAVILFLLPGVFRITETFAGDRSNATYNPEMDPVAGRSIQVFQALLMGQAQGEAVQMGSLLGILEDDELNLVGYFSGLAVPWIQLELYSGNPAEMGELVRIVSITVPEGGGESGSIESLLMLSTSEKQELLNGQLYFNVRTLGDRSDDLIGQIHALTVDNPLLLETSFWQIRNAWPSRRGGVLAALEGNDLRLVGFISLDDFVSQISVYRGGVGEPGELLAVVWHDLFVSQKNFAGFDHTLSLTEELKQDLLDGSFYLEINPFAQKVQGRLFLSTNQAPAAAEITAPAAGSTLVIGGAEDNASVDPETPLAEISFSTVEDPDGDPVAYFWQVSRTADFGPTVSALFEVGPNETTLPFTVAGMAAVFDAAWNPFPLPLQTPVQFYHRIIATDGVHYTFGPSAMLTLVRGSITANEAEGELPDAFTLHGNYPNPFNPATTITFDLPSEAVVHVEVFNLLGRRVLSVPARAFPAGAAHEVQIDGASLSSGAYLYRLYAETSSGIQVVAGAMSLIK